MGASFDSPPWDWLGWFVDVYLEPAGDEGTNSFTQTKKGNFYWSPLIDGWVGAWVKHYAQKPNTPSLAIPSSPPTHQLRSSHHRGFQAHEKSRCRLAKEVQLIVCRPVVDDRRFPRDYLKNSRMSPWRYLQEETFDPMSNNNSFLQMGQS